MKDDALRRNAVTVTGEGHTILFAHGFGTSQRMWRQIVGAFGDHQVVTLDHVGWGASARKSYDPTRHNSLSGYVSDLIEVAETLRIRDGVFVGHSIGAVMGICLGIRAPHLFNKFVLIGASACYLNDGAYRGGFDRSQLNDLLSTLDLDQDRWADRIAELAVGNPKAAQAAIALSDNLKLADKDFLKSFAALTFFHDIRADLSGMGQPVLLLQTHDDPIVPATAAQYLCEHLPNCSLQMLLTRGHFPHETAPGLVVNAIKTFITTT